MVDITFGLAFIAGLLSFISPCVLPLVPAYIGYMGGRMTRTIAVQTAGSSKIKADGQVQIAKANMLLHGLAFIGGFTVVFVVIGLATTAFVSVLGSATNIATDIIGRLGGVIIILFGLHFMGVLPRVFAWLRARPGLLASPLFTLGVALAAAALLLWGFVEWVFALPALAAFGLWLVMGGAFSQPDFWNNTLSQLETIFYSDTRREMQANGKEGLGGSFLMGIVFSAGWTPCIGPIYGAVLTLAANTGDVGKAAPLLAAYSLGLGVPFLTTALLMDQAQGLMRRLQKHMHKIELASGSLLILIGILVASGQLARLSQSLGNSFADLSFRIEACGVGFFEGELAFNQVGSCLGGTLLPVVVNQGANGTLSDELPRMEYVFRLEESSALNIELRNASEDFSAIVQLLGPDGTELQRAEVADLVEGRGLALEGINLEAGGPYSLIFSQAEGAAAPATFRVRLVPQAGA